MNVKKYNEWFITESVSSESRYKLQSILVNIGNELKLIYPDLETQIESYNTLILKFKTKDDKESFMQSDFINKERAKYDDKSIIVNRYLSSSYGYWSVEIFIKDLYIKTIVPPRYVFHRTSKENRKSIEKHGILPRCNPSDYGQCSYDKPFVFATINPDELYSNTFVIQDGFDIWIIDTSKLDNVKWYIDFNFPNDNNHIMTNKAIPVSALKRVSDKVFNKNIDKYKSK